MTDTPPTVKRFEGGKPPIEFYIGEDQYHALGTLAADPFVELLTIIGNIARRSREAQEARKAAEAAVEARKAELRAEGKSDEEVDAEAALVEGGSFDIEQLKAMKDAMAQACDIALVPESADRMKRGLAGELAGNPDQLVVSFDAISDALDAVASGDIGADAALARFQPAAGNPIEPVQFSTLQDVMMWLLEQHKLRQMPKAAEGDEGATDSEEADTTERPTVPPSDSPTGSSTTGGGSEAS